MRIVQNIEPVKSQAQKSQEYNATTAVSALIGLLGFYGTIAYIVLHFVIKYW